MVSSQERMKILKMVEDKKITPEEAVKLLSAVDTSNKPPAPTAVKTRKPKWLKIRVIDLETQKPKVNVNLPLKLIDAGLNIAAQFAPDIEVEEMMVAVREAIEENITGKIIDVTDSEDKEHVEIIIE